VRRLWSRNWHENEEGKEEKGEGKGEEGGCGGGRDGCGDGPQQRCLIFKGPAFRFVNAPKKNQ